MRFEWDAAKNRRNVAERGIDFAYAAQVFDGHMLIWADMRADYGEQREIGLGEIGGRVFAIVWTMRGSGVCRIISARKANARETALYAAHQEAK